MKDKYLLLIGGGLSLYYAYLNYFGNLDDDGVWDVTNSEKIITGGLLVGGAYLLMKGVK